MVLVFTNMEILRDKLPPNIYRRLELAEIYSLDYFLFKTVNEICDKTKLSVKDAQSLIDIVSHLTVNGKFTTVQDLKNNQTLWKKLYVGCSIIDQCIDGIPARGINEIFGESGSGKTQISLQLALQVQKLEQHGGLRAGTIYICSEDMFPSKRLHEMTEFHPNAHKYNKTNNYTDDIYVEHIQDAEQFKHCVNIRIPILLSKFEIKLIIIDSIAGVFRYDNELDDYVSRSEDLREIAHKLNRLCMQYNLVVLCINQITSDPSIGDKPCLGLTWSHLVRMRIKLSKANETVLIENKYVPLRNLTVLHSPAVPVRNCQFLITKFGVVGYE